MANEEYNREALDALLEIRNLLRKLVGQREAQPTLPHSSFNDNNAFKCPTCGSPMIRRVARATNEVFYGCAKFPVCRGTRSEKGEARQTGQPVAATENKKPPF